MMRSHHTKNGGKAPKKWGASIARKRCPRCKKVRAKWFGANYVWVGGHRAMWQHFEGQLVCHVCAERLGLPPRFAQNPNYHDTMTKEPQ
jgi:hypothetical protein